MTEYIIIVAGGSGTRFGSEVPKQFLEINGLPVIMHSINRFIEYSDKINVVVALPSEQFALWEDLRRKHSFSVSTVLCNGGETRFHSVQNALNTISDLDALVGIHDAVRPLVGVETIRNCFRLARAKGNAVPVVTLEESIREVHGGNSKSVDRSTFRIVQTPQVFRSEVLKEAYKQPFSVFFTDDASVVEAAGHTIHLAEGNKENRKLTTKEDVGFFSYFLSKEN